jgi:hypothetical protein
MPWATNLWRPRKECRPASCFLLLLLVVVVIVVVVVLLLLRFTTQFVAHWHSLSDCFHLRAGRRQMCRCPVTRLQVVRCMYVNAVSANNAAVHSSILKCTDQELCPFSMCSWKSWVGMSCSYSSQERTEFPTPTPLALRSRLS